MTAHADAIRAIADARFQRAKRNDPLTLVRECKAGGIPVGLPEIQYMFAGPLARHGAWLLPPEVVALVVDVVAPQQPKSVLDVWSSAGTLAVALNQRHRPERFDALCWTADEAELLTLIDGSAGISAHLGDPLETLKQSSEKYDAVTGAPPFGCRPQQTPAVRIGDEEVRVSGDYSAHLVLQACQQLSDGGVGVFVVPPAFLLGAGRGGALDVLRGEGIRLTAAVELPSGTFHPVTEVPGHVVVLQRSTADVVYTAKFAPDPEHRREIISSLARVGRGRPPAVGRLVPAETFKGYSQAEREERQRTTIRDMGLVAYPFAEVVSGLHGPPATVAEKLPDRPNSVYLPLMAATRATTSQDELPVRLKSYVQLVINPEVADAGFVAAMLNTDFGQDWRDSLRSGMTIPRISKSALQTATFYLPPPADRAVQRQALQCQAEINSLRLRLNEIEAALWTRPTGVGEVQEAIRSVNRAENVTDWIDSLPFPLASVLWACHTQTGSYRSRWERKVHFFEALAEFVAVVHLSAFTANPAVWPALQEKLSSSLAKARLSFKMATFGTWKATLEVLTKEARTLLDKQPDLLFELFKTRNRRLLAALGSSRLVEIVSKANSIRNQSLGHAAVKREAEERATDDELQSLIAGVREVFGHHWQGYELLLPGVSRRRDGLYHQEARSVMGTRTPFPGRTVELAEAMEDEHLYLKGPDERHALRLLPLVKIMPSPRTEENACYFYNRRERSDGLRFLSYHFEADAEVISEFSDVSAVLNTILPE